MRDQLLAMSGEWIAAAAAVWHDFTATSGHEVKLRIGFGRKKADEAEKPAEEAEKEKPKADKSKEGKPAEAPKKKPAKAKAEPEPEKEVRARTEAKGQNRDFQAKAGSRQTSLIRGRRTS